MPAGDGIEILRRQRPKAAVSVVGMVQDDHPNARRGAHGGHKLGPLAQLVIRNWTAGHDGKGVEMASFGGDFVTNNTGEKP